MEATLAIKATDLTKDFMDGLMKVFSKNAILNITVTYDTGNQSAPAKKEDAPKSTATPGKKRGRKPKVQESMPMDTTPKKRGRKPKVVVE